MTGTIARRRRPARTAASMPGRAGGSSADRAAINAMAHVRGHPDDFAAWAEAGGDRWSYDGAAAGLPPQRALFGRPLRRAWGRRAARPSFCRRTRSTRWCGTSCRRGGRSARRGSATTTSDLSPARRRIRSPSAMAGASAWPMPTSRRRPAAGSLSSQAASSSGCDPRRAASSASRCGATARSRHFSADTVVVSSGTIASPLLLMRSGIGEPEMLRAAGIPCRIPLAGVGRNLHDHLLAGRRLCVAAHGAAVAAAAFGIADVSAQRRSGPGGGRARLRRRLRGASGRVGAVRAARSRAAPIR